MLKGTIGALIVAGLVMLACTGDAWAQEKVKVGTFEYFYGTAKVKEIGATGTFIQVEDSWLDRGLYKGDEVVTGAESKLEIAIESTKVEMLDSTFAVMDKTDEGLYVIHMKKGSITAHIKTEVFQLRVYNQTIQGKGCVVNVKTLPDNDVVVTALSGAAYVENEYGAILIIPREQAVTISYDRLRRVYIFRPSPENRENFGVIPKGEKDKIDLGRTEEYVLSEDGKGEIRKFVVPGTGADAEPAPKPVRIFSINALMSYDWFESSADVYYFDGEKETFNTKRASLAVGTKFQFAEIFLGIDAVRDNPLEDLWLRLFFHEKEKAFNFKIGQMHVPFGIQAQTYPHDLLLPDYSLAVKYAFAGIQGTPGTSDLDYLFDTGFQIGGEFELFAGMDLQYNVGFFNGEKRVTNETNDRKTAIGRLGLNFSDKFILGGSSYDGELFSHANRISRRRNGIDFRIKGGQVTIQGEYIWAEDNPVVGKKYNITEGYYLEGGLGLGAVRAGWDKLTLVCRIDMLDPPKGLVNPGAENQHARVTAYAFGFIWKMSEEVKFTAMFETMDQGKDRYLAPLEKADIDQKAIFQFNISF